MDKYLINKQADMDKSNFTNLYPFAEQNTGKPTLNNDGSLKVGTGYITDNLGYTNNEEYIIITELRINQLDLAQLGYGSQAFNFTSKRITSVNEDPVYFTEIDYAVGDVIQFKIQRTRTQTLWTITDANGTSETHALPTQNRDWIMRAHGTNTDIDILNYTRLTKIEENEDI